MEKKREDFWVCPICQSEFKDDPEYYKFCEEHPDGYPNEWHYPFCPECDVELALRSGEHFEPRGGLRPFPPYLGFHDSTKSDEFWHESPNVTRLYFDADGNCTFMNQDFYTIKDI